MFEHLYDFVDHEPEDRHDDDFPDMILFDEDDESLVFELIEVEVQIYNK
jgi:hypothetical protein